MNDVLSFASRTIELLRSVQFGEWEFEVGCKATTVWLRVSDPKAVCNETGTAAPWKGRKWMLSVHMTESEVVQTAFKAVLTAQEHEARERFLYKGAPIFGPHWDVDALARFWQHAGPAASDVRPAFLPHQEEAR